MKNISSWLKWTWSGGPSPGLCHPMRTEMAPPVASVVRSTFTSRPKGLIRSACSGLTMVAWSGDGLAFMFSLIWVSDCYFERGSPSVPARACPAMKCFLVPSFFSIGELAGEDIARVGHRMGVPFHDRVAGDRDPEHGSLELATWISRIGRSVP